MIVGVAGNELGYNWVDNKEATLWRKVNMTRLLALTVLDL
jgi:hypothetical protein